MKVTEGDPGIQVEEDTFAGVRGLRIHVRTWLPAGAPTGVVVIAHGFAEHGGRYAAVAERLVADGLAVRAADHRGHGLSEGKRTSVVRFGDYVDDLNTVIAQARARWPSQPLVLLGHSMGGLIALDLAVRPATHSTVSSSRHLQRVPATCRGSSSPSDELCPALRRTRAFCASRSTGSAETPRWSTPTTTTRSCFARRSARGSVRRCSTRWTVSTPGLPSLHVPLLVMQGTADGLVDPGCGPHVYERAGSTDKTLKMYDGLWHEIFNEPERDHVLGDLIAWLRTHLAASRG